MSRFSRLLIAACALAAAACSDSTSPPTPTTIVLSSATVSLDALGATQTLTAVVKDQHDQAMPAASVTWTASNAAVTVAPVAGSSANVVVTSALNGESLITATSGQASATVKIIVAQVPASVQLLGGNAQTAVVASPLLQPIGVRVLDSRGAPVAGQIVSFSVTQGGGSVSTPTANTNGDGAAYVSWTLGRVALQPQQVTATFGALSPVTFTAGAIAGPPASIRVNTGDGQSGSVGVSLPVSPTVLVADAFSNPIPNLSVTFTTNSGTVAVPVAQTNDAGIASAGLWTLGTTPGAKTLTASVNGASSATMNATALVGLPASVTIVSGNNQSATINTAVQIAPSVRVTDVFSNVISGTDVIFVVTAGGGRITGATATTNASGIATLGSWTLGSVAGTNTVAASAGSSAGAAFTAQATTAVSGGASTPVGTATTNSGTNQSGFAGTAVTNLPSVVVHDATGNPMAGVNVAFSLTTGGGSITGATATTDASGVATLGGWTLGATANVNVVTATVTSTNASGGPFVFSVAGCEGSGAGYAITVCYRTAMTASQRQAFVDAAARWRSIITSELPDVSLNIGAGQCDTNTPSINMTADDLVILAAIEPIDGVGNILGSAGWCFRRTGGLPVLGTMRFDIADVAALEAGNRLNAVILHEMGHVIGVGTMWTIKGLLQSPSTSSSTLDTYFSGVSGIAGFDAIGGLTYTLGQKVPVENTGGVGTMNAHWRESVLANELMTGFLNTGSNPLSALTVRSLEDIGYTVNASAADPFALALSLRSSLGGDPDALNLGNDAYTGRQSTIDTRGKIVRIR
jgi:hypothetical protein